MGRDRDPSEGPTTSITTTYSQQGTPVKVIDPTSGITVESGYYLDGMTRRVTESGSGLSGTGNTNTYAYNGAGAVSVRTDDAGSGLTSSGPGGVVTTSYRYNQAGLPAEMTSGVLSAGTSYTWDSVGRLKKAQTGTHLAEWSWQANNVLAGAKTTANGTTVGEYTYLYDKSRNVTQQKVTGSAGGYTNDYEYTPAEQVKKWTHHVVSGGGTDRTVSYEWDRNSNRTKVTDSSGGSSSVTTTAYGQDNAIVSSTSSAGTLSYTYDNAGRMKNDGCNAYTYDAFDRIEKQVLTGSGSGGGPCGTKSRTTTYSYDGLDRQRSMTVSNASDAAPGSSGSAANGTVRSIYDGSSTTVVGQLDAVNGALSKPDVLYQLDPGGAAMAYKQTGAGAGTSFLDTDGLDNVTAVVASGSSVECGTRYDPFGNPVDPDTGTTANGVCHTGGGATTSGNSYWYRSQTRDGSTGNYQLGARTYDPTKAAFTTPDAYRVSSPSTDLGVGTDPLTANTYTYVNGNPLNFSDPDGHDPMYHCSKPGGCQSMYTGGARVKAALAADSAGRANRIAAQARIREIKSNPSLKGSKPDAYHVWWDGGMYSPGFDEESLEMGGGTACYGFMACDKAWRYYSKHKDLAGAIDIAANYCYQHPKTCMLGIDLRYAGLAMESGAGMLGASRASRGRLGNSSGRPSNLWPVETPVTPKMEARFPGEAIPASKVRFSQRSVNGASEIEASMRKNGWVGGPIDVVKMPDGGFTSLDNTRVLAANRAGIDVRANVHSANALIPDSMAERFASKKGVLPTTWGEAVSNRIANQGARYSTRYPYGSPFTGWMGK